jgi:hypothetical protein
MPAVRPQNRGKMPTFRIEDEHGQWLANMRWVCPTGRHVTRIPRGTDTLEVIDVRVADYEDEHSTLVVRTVQADIPISD